MTSDADPVLIEPEAGSEWPLLLRAFDGESRQRVLCTLLDLEAASVPEISERSGLSAATITRHMAALEALGVVASDMPRGVRTGRVVNFRVDASVYERCLELWDSRMRVHKR